MRLFLAGDLMTARGIDQVLPHPGNPELHEPFVRDAREYVRLAEEASGPIPSPVGFSYVWGALEESLAPFRPGVRIANLETSVTYSDAFAREKGIHYRMTPRNAEVLRAGSFDCLSLANNHVLDWGPSGLEETMATLDAFGIGFCGAGKTAAAAAAPWRRDFPDGSRLSVFGVGDRSSGIGRSHAATVGQPGIRLKPSTREAEHQISGEKDAVKVTSIHWGGNWGWEIPKRQQSFAHGMIDRAGVSVVHGHSSHHPKGVEFYGGRLILYGIGDFINDYEGIRGHERYRPELTTAYVVDIIEETGAVTAVTALAFRIRRFRLEPACASDTAWLAETLTRTSPRNGARFRQSGSSENTITVEPGT